MGEGFQSERGGKDAGALAGARANGLRSHIIFNSTALDCSQKFRNFWGSSHAIRRLSDQLCAENGLSIIEHPKPSRGHYGAWLDGAKLPTLRDGLRDAIDHSLPAGISFDEFITAMHAAGYECKQGKHLAFKGPGQQRYIRCDSLGEDYMAEAIHERLSGKRIVVPRQKRAAPNVPQKPNMLIDIQAKIQTGKGAGYAQWAKVFNLKEAAKTLVLLQERGLTDYDLLTEQAAASSEKYHQVSERLKTIEKRTTEITNLQKHIGAYVKTRDIYRQYREAGYNKKFYAAHESDILIHQSAKRAFDELGLKKLPTINALRQEYATLDAERKKLYPSYRLAREEMQTLLVVKNNVDRLLNRAPLSQTHRSRSEPEL